MRGIDPDLRIFVAGMDASVTGIRSIPQLNLPPSTISVYSLAEERLNSGRRSVVDPFREIVRGTLF